MVNLKGNWAGDKMNTLYQDGKKIIMKKIGIFCLICSAVLLCSALTWGNSVASLLGGSKEFENYEPYLFETNADDAMNHAYFDKEITMITGSYAEYGNVKENQIENQTVYYLMPTERGDHFITVIAHGSITGTLDEMENAFYNSIGSETKKYPDPLMIKGGFKKLQPEELKYALDYFKAYDPEIQSEADVLTVLSPYAIVVDQIDSIPVSSLWILLILWILIVLVFTLCVILYFSGICLKTLDADIGQLSDGLKDILDDDYKKAVVYEPLKIGDRLLYLRERWTWRVYDYDEIIWIYQKEELHKLKRRFEVCAYNKKGHKIILYHTQESKKAIKVAQKVFDHCHYALFGYESYIYEYWLEYPEKLYDKLKELSLIKEKIGKEREKEKEKVRKLHRKKRQMRQQKKLNK